MRLRNPDLNSHVAIKFTGRQPFLLDYHATAEGEGCMMLKEKDA